MLLRALPDLTAGDPEFCRWFQSKWGRENCIIWGRARYADFGPLTHTLSIRAAWGGIEACHVNGRTIAVDDDNFLILNHGQSYATSIRSQWPVESFAISFRPGLAERTCGAMAMSIEQGLAQGDTIAERTVEFMEHLQPHDRTVTPILRYIKSHLLHGFDDEAWYEEQLLFLLERMRRSRRNTLTYVEGLQLVRAATRREIFRRICIATDFLHAHYAESLDLGRLAQVAYLSKYHFLRLFRLVHKMTPFEYLQRKRARVAVRLMQSTEMTVGEVATSVGYATSSALVRHFRRCTGLAPQQLRKARAVQIRGHDCESALID